MIILGVCLMVCVTMIFLTIILCDHIDNMKSREIELLRIKHKIPDEWEEGMDT